MQCINLSTYISLCFSIFLFVCQSFNEIYSCYLFTYLSVSLKKIKPSPQMVKKGLHRRCYFFFCKMLYYLFNEYICLNQLLYNINHKYNCFSISGFYSFKKKRIICNVYVYNDHNILITMIKAKSTSVHNLS